MVPGSFLPLINAPMKSVSRKVPSVTLNFLPSISGLVGEKGANTGFLVPGTPYVFSGVPMPQGLQVRHLHRDLIKELPHDI